MQIYKIEKKYMLTQDLKKALQKAIGIIKTSISK